ncbi:MAG: hypothetical protein HYX20_00765 [Candidatus Yanofskybacteria bacterium]|nr:hypothetical protein [Candidatus Yanofskybacteria bacterium]
MFYRLDIIKETVANKQKIIIAATVVLVIAAGAGFWYWSKSKQVQTGAPTLGSEIFEKTQNLLKGQVPDANPFKDQKNPLDAIYQNPFE